MMSISGPFLGATEHLSGRNRAVRWSILVGKQKHNVQRPNSYVATRTKQPAFRDAITDFPANT